MPPDLSRAFWTVAAKSGEIREAALGKLAPGHVRVRARASGISRGTEALVFAGRVPESEHARMRAPFQAGEFPFPVKYGYAAVGDVIDGGPAMRVFCLHPHQDVFDLPVAMARPVPRAVSDARATLAANMETAINALWDAPPSVGDRIAVIGAGTIGLLVAWLARRTAGAHVTVIEPDAARAAVAARLGLAVLRDDVRPHDLVFHASGRPEGLVHALSLAGAEARIVELSWYGETLAALPLGRDFHVKRLSIVGSQVGQLPPSRRPRWDHGKRLSLALELLADPALDALIGPPIAFADLPREMPRLMAGPSPFPHNVVIYPESV